VNTVLRMVSRGAVRVDGVWWYAPELELHHRAVVGVRVEAGRAEAVLDGATIVLARLEG